MIGVKENETVLAPNLTFVATINAISYTGAEPILVDICEKSWQIDTDLLEDWLINNTKTKIIDNKPATIQSFW